MANAIFEAHLKDAPEVRPYFRGHFGNEADRRAAVERACERPIEADVAGALAAQNARLPASPAREANLRALRGGAAAVVTGQQVGLLLGPLYTVYKAASAVRAAEQLSRESGRPVVPIFWLQTEDHDLVEIASCHVPCPRGDPLTLAMEADPNHRRSIAHVRLPESIEACVAMLATELAGLPHAQDSLQLIERHYRAGAGYGQGFAGLLAELFDGMVLIDPRDPGFARVARSVHRTAIARAAELASALCDRTGELERAGFSAQVHVRPGAPLSFFHPEGPEGPRVRIDPAQHSERELLAHLDRDPLLFSTSALSRPILQDSLLPTAAYVGGPSEVAYFAQLGPLYAAYDLPMPLVVPRARICVVEEKSAKLLARFGLTERDAELAEDALLARLRGSDSSAEALRSSLIEPFERALTQARGIDPSVDKAADKTLRSVNRSIDKLIEKYERARLHQDERLVEDVRRLKLALTPEDIPQERFFSLPYFLARYGRAFIERVHDTIDPFDPTPKVLTP